ncbi:lytic transglycosylase domain-containing protein [Burkholderia vietnamiensis]|uniref:lytic transglycosylase domain-containing protein n=1 Tax=Burkholderia vietnamiensis TaxID=60552 RepID=UPI001B9EC9B2|nr:lytic transglycosylase domain-containing protein [Burkholderia vietnamiensis]MBR8279074.1 lytic transglycosylase domain-containing protein [Burkholderia vietnamiensis]
MKGKSSPCVAFLPFIAIAVLSQGLPSAFGDVYLTRLDDGTPCYSDAPRNRTSRRISNPSIVSHSHSKIAVAARLLDSKSHWNIVVKDVAAQYGVDPALVQAVIDVESHFNPNAKSGTGAAGMMQLMPLTASRYGVTDAFDAYQNIDAGVRHLKMLLDQYHGNVVLALSAYNAGERTIIAHHRLIPPYRETMLYVPKVLARYEVYRAMNVEQGGIR